MYASGEVVLSMCCEFARKESETIFFLLDDLKKPDLHRQAEESMQKILKENPKIDFAVLCNYVRQSQI